MMQPRQSDGDGRMQKGPLVVACIFALAVAGALPAHACGLAESSSSLRLSKPASGPLAAGFGLRRHPILGSTRLHAGWDYRLPLGASVRAAAPGRIAAAGYDGPYGNLVVIDHGGGLETAYAHLSRIGVAQGTCVETGAEIGAAGSTGLSAEPHLHFEVRKDGQPTDPGQWFGGGSREP
jgi:murein DD-endopeptidase MepM/ murein hydrolase activator NlpD